MIELSTLGRGSVRRDGEELAAISKHKQKYALLVYLALEGRVTRDRLLSLFWPERDDEKARHSLSQALYALRRELQEECLYVEGDVVAVASENCSLDARQLEEAAAAEHWDTVIDLYAGPFLEGFALPGAPEFEKWQSSSRSRLARLARRGFGRAVEERAAAGDVSGALGTASHWVALDPLEDEAQHALIALLARSGDRTAALEQYEAYRKRLADELEVEPLEATVALVDRIRAGVAPAREQAAEAVGVAREVEPGRWPQLFHELRGRRVYHVAAAYLAFAVLVLELGSTLIERGILAQWVFPALLVFSVIGFPFALLLAWAQEETRVAVGVPTRRRWPRWAEKVRAVHLLAVLSALVVGLLIGRAFLWRGPAVEAPVEAAALDPARIAVFYFDDLSESRELGHLAEGFTETLITQLAQVPNLKVLSRNAVKPYRDTEIPLDSIVQRLAVGTLVEGSVMGSQARMRVNVQLIDAASLAHLESAAVDGARGDPLALLDQLADTVSQLLRQRLGLEIRLRESRRATQSTEAWETHRRAAQMLANARGVWAAGDRLNAVQLYERVDSVLRVAESLDASWTDPIVLRGWVALDRARLLEQTARAYDREWLQTGIRHAERALALDPQSTAALELRGTLRLYLWETADSLEGPRLRQSAEQDLRAAVAADPSNASAWSRLSQSLRYAGQFAEAKQAAVRALEADEFLTDAVYIYWQLCNTSLDLEQFADAIRWCSRGRQRFPDTPVFVEAQLILLASSYGPEPDVEEAWRLAEARLALSAPAQRQVLEPTGLMDVAAVLARAGLRDSARSVIQRARGLDARNDPWVDYTEANAHLHLGEADDALRLLEEFLSARPDRRAYIAKDPWFRVLHDDPRFRALVGADSLS